MNHVITNAVIQFHCYLQFLLIYNSFRKQLLLNLKFSDLLISKFLPLFPYLSELRSIHHNYEYYKKITHT